MRFTGAGSNGQQSALPDVLPERWESRSLGEGSGTGRTLAPTAMGSSTGSARSLLLAVTSAHRLFS